VVRDVRRATRKHHSAEDKIRVATTNSPTLLKTAKTWGFWHLSSVLGGRDRILRSRRRLLCDDDSRPAGSGEPPLIEGGNVTNLPA
jgi:hypothetical protein